VDGAVGRESQVLNFVVFISCRTWSDVPKAYGSLKEPLHATHLVLRLAMPRTLFFFNAGLITAELGGLSIASVQQ
jgi:hypothetical protein